MKLEQWVRGLGARTVDAPPAVEEKPVQSPPRRRQKTHLTLQDLPRETIHLEMNGRPFFVVLRDEKVYMSYRTSSGTTCVKGVKPRGAKEAALALARLLHLSKGEWPDRNVALACNWPNVVAPPLALVALNKTAPRWTATSVTKSTRESPHGSLEFDGVARTRFPMAMLPSDAVQVKVANRLCYVLLNAKLVFMRVESWNASAAYLREITDLSRKNRLVALAQEQVANGGNGRLLPNFG
jgi:hypothetical protein